MERKKEKFPIYTKGFLKIINCTALREA